jgi:hypothetical protein
MRTISSDHGRQTARHSHFTVATGVQLFLCDHAGAVFKPLDINGARPPNYPHSPGASER